ncbi:MarR family winged helix-turn-helix transcriptional regulator [uncultured Williamsia sp.]|uniref:MarR family winged helix-turn-helix transcriptional regulator n=1 Tax=uncultured Williamsia sp. TaxID=259311 RepID=UPI002615C52B|nr:MarR family winged helix-turn-helix transcriptional regulator [uncultured Williamsia sp.]
MSDTVASDLALRAAGDTRVAVGRLLRRLREVSTGDELTPAQASVLARVGKGEASTAARLAEVENVRPQSMSATIAALERVGLLERHADPGDGRRQIVMLTAAGRDADDHNHRARTEWLTETVAERLSDDECATLIEAARVIEKLVAR